MTKNLILGLILGISMSFISWIIGMIINFLLSKTEYYQIISNLNFIKSKTLNKNIGMNSFKWIVTNTLFKFFNQKIKLKNKKTDLTEIRNEMTFAEISHLIGFIFVTVVAIYFSFTKSPTIGILMMLPNILMNFYPSLLQQENKRRIDNVLLRQEKL